MALSDAIAALFGWRRVVVYDHSVVAATIQGMDAYALYKRQPALRAVVSFLADNVAGIPLKCYERRGDADRPRDTGSDLARLLTRPCRGMTTHELVRATVSDYLLVGDALWFVYDDEDAPSGRWVRYIPWSWVCGKETLDGFEPSVYRVSNPYTGYRADLPAEDCIRFFSYDPRGTMDSSSAIEALKDVLSEQLSAWEYRNGVWKNGGRVSQWISRPANSPWEPGARERFAKSWKARFAGKDATDTGGTPLLEDGMRLETTTFNAREAQWQEATRLAREDVAAVYHVNPSLIWHTDGQTYASAKDNARALYADTLTPLLDMVEERLNGFLVPMLGMDPATHYCEFDLSSKLAASFEEQASVLQSSVGGPWMLRNEARARMNLPALEGGDELIVPLNVSEGGLAGPNDTDPTVERYNARPALNVKVEPVERGDAAPFGNSFARLRSKATPAADQDLGEVLRRFYRRQATSLANQLASMSPEDIDLTGTMAWWNKDRWMRELTEELVRVGEMPTTSAAWRAFSVLGLDPDDLSQEPIRRFVHEFCESRAEDMVQSVFERLVADLTELKESVPQAEWTQEKIRNAVIDSFARKEDVRVRTNSSSLSAGLANGGLCLGARQADKNCQKEWVTSGQRTRDSHARMDGERVSVWGEFSNGARWPCDSNLDASESCNCRCRLEIVAGKDRASGKHLARLRKEADGGTKAINAAWQDFKRDKSETHYQETVGKAIREWSADGRITARFYAKPEGKELQAARALAKAGHVVEFLSTLGSGKHADIYVDGVKADFKRIESFDPDKVFTRIRDCAEKADIAVIDLMLDRVQLSDAIIKANNAIGNGIIARDHVYIIDWHGVVHVV